MLFTLLKKSLRVREHGRENIDATLASGGFIYSAWHQNLITAALAQQAGPLVILASRSRTADPMVRFCETLGHTVVRGSSKRGGRDKGGSAAKSEMIRLLQQGANGAVTPDGPQGPAKVAKPGVVEMAAESQLAIIPLLAQPRRYWQFKSWDQMQLVKPFSVVDVYYGEAIHIPANLSAESKQQLLEQVSAATNALGQ